MNSVGNHKWWAFLTRAHYSCIGIIPLCHPNFRSVIFQPIVHSFEFFSTGEWCDSEEFSNWLFQCCWNMIYNIYIIPQISISLRWPLTDICFRFVGGSRSTVVALATAGQRVELSILYLGRFIKNYPKINLTIDFTQVLVYA